MMENFGQLCAVSAALGCLYLLLAIGVVVRRRSGTQPRPAATPEPVSVLLPLCGDEPELARCLASFCAQDYGAEVQVVMGVHHLDDTALPVAQAIKARFAHLPIVIQVDETSHGANAKVSNLINMRAAAVHPVLVTADSDIHVGPSHIARVVALLQRPGVGAVSVLYEGVPAAGFWSKVSAHCINAYFLPNVLVGMALNLAKPCFGATVALRRATLAGIGGFEAFANQLADDYAIGQAVRRTGQKVEIGLFLAEHLCGEKSLREVVHHQLRWARTVKSIDMAGFAGSFITHPFAFASLGTAAGNEMCVAMLALALGLRLALCEALARAFDLKTRTIWLEPITSLLVFAVFVWSFTGNTVSWRKAQYTVLSDGSLVQGGQR